MKTKDRARARLEHLVLERWEQRNLREFKPKHRLLVLLTRACGELAQGIITRDELTKFVGYAFDHFAERDTHGHGRH